LSNEDSALVMTDLIGNKTKRIYLGHLSLHNNIKELAHMTMERTLLQNDFAVGKDFQVLDTSHESASEIFSV